MKGLNLKWTNTPVWVTCFGCILHRPINLPVRKSDLKNIDSNSKERRHGLLSSRRLQVIGEGFVDFEVWPDIGLWKILNMHDIRTKNNGAIVILVYINFVDISVDLGLFGHLTNPRVYIDPTICVNKVMVQI